MESDPHSHYKALTPEPIDVLSSWGLGVETCLSNAYYMIVRIISVRKGAEGYNGRGGIEDADKLIWWAQRLKFEMLKEQSIAGGAEL